MKIRTHRLSRKRRCVDCSIDIPVPLKNNKPTDFPPAGSDIAVIESFVLPHSSYVPGEKDSNKRCTDPD